MNKLEKLKLGIKRGRPRNVFCVSWVEEYEVTVIAKSEAEAIKKTKKKYPKSKECDVETAGFYPALDEWDIAHNKWDKDGFLVGELK